MTPGMVDLRLDLSPEPESAASARDAMGHFAGRVGQETLENLRLLVSELVTNAYRHGGLAIGQEIELTAWLRDGTVRVEVVDPGAGFSRPRDPTPDADSGWGLYLVEHIADRWGVDARGGTCVWFELSA